MTKKKQKKKTGDNLNEYIKIQVLIMYSSNVSNKSCFMDKRNIFITCDVIFSSKFTKYMILRDISLFLHIKCYKSAHNGRNYYYRILYIQRRIYHGCLCMLEAANISPSMRAPPRPMPLQGWRSVRYTQQTYGIRSFFIFLYESPHNKLSFGIQLISATDC